MPESAIICVDDEIDILKSLQLELEKAFGNSYLYELAESGDEALEVIEDLNEEGVQIIIIVSDWLMPGMKGDEFLIKVNQKYPNIIKIMLTGQADEAAIERAKKDANLYCCLYKPWKERELIDTLRSAIGEEMLDVGE